MAFALKDGDRCAFGLGWEYARRGRRPEAPEHFSLYQKEQFLEGYHAFKPSKTAAYDNPDVLPEFAKE